MAPLVNDKRSTSVEIAVELEDGPFVVAITEMSSIRTISLGPVVGNLQEHEDAIRRALDRLFTGF